MRKIVACAAVLAVLMMVGGMMLNVNAGEKSQIIKGTIQTPNQVNEESKTIVLTDNSDATKRYTMNVSSTTTKVRIDNGEGLQNGKLSDLRKGDRIECTATRTETQNTYDATEIRRFKKDQKNGNDGN